MATSAETAAVSSMSPDQRRVHIKVKSILLKVKTSKGWIFNFITYRIKIFQKSIIPDYQQNQDFLSLSPDIPGKVQSNHCKNHFRV